MFPALREWGGAVEPTPPPPHDYFAAWLPAAPLLAPLFPNPAAPPACFTRYFYVAASLSTLRVTWPPRIATPPPQRQPPHVHTPAYVPPTPPSALPAPTPFRPPYLPPLPIPAAPF